MANLKPRRVDALLDRAIGAVRRWDEFASRAGAPEVLAKRALAGFRPGSER